MIETTKDGLHNVESAPAHEWLEILRAVVENGVTEARKQRGVVALV